MPALAQDFYFEREEWDAVHEIVRDDAPADVSFIEALPERPWLIGYPAFCWAMRWRGDAGEPLGVYFYDRGEYFALYTREDAGCKLPDKILSEKIKEKK